MESLLIKKKTLKSNITKSKNDFEKGDLSNIQLELFEKKCSKFENECSKIFEEIFENCDAKDYEKYVEEQHSVQDSIDNFWIAVREQLSKLNENKKPLVSEEQKSINCDSVKLPKLTLPSFSGNIQDWLSFRDLFRASIHDNINLTGAQKLQYLKSSLRGDAFRIIQSISISDANYEIAWNLLEDRFSNKREQVFAHIKKLMSLPTIQNDSPSTILNLIDNVNEIIRSLELLDQKIENFSDTLVMYTVLQKLDSETKMWFERQLKKEIIPKLTDLIDFLKDHARTLQAGRSNKKYTPVKTTVLVSPRPVCIYCKEETHFLQKCSKFLNLNVQKRVEFIKKHNLCYNCLSQMHKLKLCKSVNKCKHCSKMHHSLLCYENEKGQNKWNKSNSLNPHAKDFIPPSEVNVEENVSPVICASLIGSYGEKENVNHAIGQKQMLLCTALIRVKDSKNNFVYARCILDSGSQGNFIRKELVDKLHLNIRESTVSVSCLGTFNAVAAGEVDLLFTPHFQSNIKVSTSAFVIDEITEKTPYVSLPNNIKYHFNDLTLADPNFHKTQSVDILFGVNVFLTLLNGSIVKRKPELPFAFSTKLGWVIAGTVLFEAPEPSPISVNCLSTNELIQRFWELEQVPTHQNLSNDEKLCELQFLKEHKREKDGRYSVSLPFKPNRKYLGDSRNTATRRFLNLEKRLLAMPEIYEQYKQFMREYLSLGHMEKITNHPDLEDKHFYMPHHFVLRESSSTTRLRVVFDASAKSSSGVSLNDTLMIGPKVQNDLFAIILRFRCHNIAITADLQKMYRQVKIHDTNRDFQRIVWRESVNKPLETFRLCTVTYGTSSAPYLATRVLKQLAIDEGKQFPQASKVVLQDFYVDDVLTGVSTIEQGRELITQLTQILKKGGFELHKWCSNELNVFKDVGVINENEACSQPKSNEIIKVLGIEWSPNTDEFKCNIVTPQIATPITKRKILSVISSIFDPLGLIAPFVISAKIFLQELWKLQLSWDEEVPESVEHKWKIIVEELTNLGDIRIPRKILLINANKIQLHAFCDASEKAYACVIYVRSLSENAIHVRMLTSKTRVAPLKSVSLPRLELCAALLLARLVRAVQSALSIKIDEIYAWSDSMIVLSWLNAEPSRWQTFVANRVSEIQTLLPTTFWNHVQSKDNPADCASRGLLPSELNSHHLWWTGPSWLSTNSIPLCTATHINEEALKEERKKVSCALSQVQNEVLHVIEKISSFSKLQRIIAYCLRFIANIKLPQKMRNLSFLTSNEISAATNCIIRIVQSVSFTKEIQCLESGKSLPTSSKILSLCPFLDSNKILRVGGRLKHAALSQNEKHPILLPKKHHLSEIIIQHFHLKYLHAAPELLLSLIRQKFWIIAARSVTRLIVRKCVICIRYRAEAAKQIMADLPEKRVTQSKPFQFTGTDFAGPYLIKYRAGRGQKSFKCYVCIFVCFTSKAVHLEVVEDLTSNAFLSALKRFISRRGKPFVIHSDCGSNFKGANREIQKHFAQLRQNEKVQEFLAEEEIKWKFNPPSAPHFGGLWESAVKSMKYHLKRTIGDAILTYGAFSTLIVQIEACLNSRPLCPMSMDPNDYTPLTPAHFLIGTAITALPEPDLSQNKISLLDRWHVAQAIFQQFWKRWSREYLTQLQQRRKWFKDQRNLEINDLVLIKDDNVPPLKWKLGRVIKVHPGPDKKVRVVTIQTSNGVTTRPIVKLCPLQKD